MMNDIRNNLETEIAMAREMSSLFDTATARVDEQRLIKDAMASLQTRIKLVHQSTREMIKAFTPVPSLTDREKKVAIERIEVQGRSERVAIRSRDKSRYLQELGISETLLRKLRKKKQVVEKEEEHRKPNGYARISNRFFFTFSQRMLEKSVFKDLNMDLRKANMNVLAATYLSMIFFSVLLALIVGVLVSAAVILFTLTPEAPFIALYTGEYLTRITIALGTLILLPIGTVAFMYFYPSMEARSLANHIENELPFVVIHMGSIAGSGVEPTHIFKIVGLSNDYPATRTEIRKLLNQVNVYGYDMITALKNVARLTPSPRLAELFNGLATTISSGGDLKTFFEKRAETLLLQYRIEREKFTKVAETFMDLYISVVIAAPMILLLLLIMISVSGVSTFISQNNLTFLIIIVVAFINIIFLWVIGLKQPKY